MGGYSITFCARDTPCQQNKNFFEPNLLFIGNIFYN